MLVFVLIWMLAFCWSDTSLEIMAAELQKLDIERYSDRKLKAKKVMPPLWHFIKLDPDHMPAELGRGWCSYILWKLFTVSNEHKS